MPLSDDDIREILKIVAETELDELRVETEGFSLYVSRRGGGEAPSLAPRRQGAREDASPPPDPLGDDSKADGLVTIKAPMLGTFYRAEGPGRDPFVEVGSEVGPDTTVCILEVMKMMNSVPAGVAGTVVEVCQDNAQLVEHGQPLFRVRPA
jgi:acetyl-CoA carboxylase biotin carboxyl carrier protein